MNIKKILLAVVLFAAGVTWFVWYSDVKDSGTMDSIDFIASHFTGRGQIMDYQNDLGVESIEDIKWYNEKDTIEIEFGKIRLTFDKKKFDTQEVIDALERIHITVRKNEETQEYKLYFNGEKIDLYVK